MPLTGRVALDIGDPSERCVLQPVGEQCVLAEDFDAGVGGRQPAGQDEQQAGCGAADGNVGFAVAAGDGDADGVRVTSHSPVPDSPGSVA